MRSASQSTSPDQRYPSRSAGAATGSVEPKGLLALYDAAFARTRIVDVTAAIIERATELRARYGLRSPDAIHLGTAIDEGADVFITGDATLARCTEIDVDVLTPMP